MYKIKNVDFIVCFGYQRQNEETVESIMKLNAKMRYHEYISL